MTLTWQDVAGQVRAPDFTEASNLITQGIGNLGTAVRDVVGGPEDRRRADLAKQLLLVNMQQEGMQKHAEAGRQLGHDMKVIRKEKDQEEFSAAQSIIEAGAREAGLSGKNLQEFLASNEAYQKLDEGARAYGASHLSDAFLRGDETRIQQQERAADNARQERQFQMSYNLQAENTRLARIERAEAAAERKADRELAAASKPKVWKTGNDKTDKAMTILAQRTGAQYSEASGEAYATASSVIWARAMQTWVQCPVCLRI